MHQLWGFDTRLLYAAVLVLVGFERLWELVLTARNRQWARPRGGVEFGRRHHRWMVALHTAFLGGCAAEVLGAFGSPRPFHAASAVVWSAVLVLAMGLRYWAITSLGPRWSTRVVVVPNLRAIDSGPYRWLRHPNYLAVIAEGLAIPLLHGAWITCLLFQAGNAVLLTVRIRCEERALREFADYETALAGRARFVPAPRAAR
jgi:methyltransferase